MVNIFKKFHLKSNYFKKKSGLFRKKIRKTFNFDNTIKILIYITVFLIPLFYMPFLSAPWELGKAFIFYALVLIAAGLWIFKIVINKEFQWKKNPLSIWIGVFFIIYLFSGLFSIDPLNSFLGQPKNLGGSILSIFFFILFYYLIVNFFQDKKSIFRLLSVFLLSFFIILLVKWLALLSFKFWPSMLPFFNFDLLTNSPVVLSVILSFVSVLALSLLQYSEHKCWKYFLKIFIFLALVLEFLMGLWQGLVVLIVLLALFILTTSFKLKTTSSSYIIMPAIFLATALILFFVPMGDILGFSFVGDIALDYNTATAISRSSLANNLFLGSGPLNFYYNFNQYKPLFFNSFSVWNLSFVKSAGLWLELVSTIGLFGLLSLIALCLKLVFLFGKKILREDRGKIDFSVFLFIIFLVIAIGGFFVSFNWLMWFFFWFVIALLISWKKGKEESIKFSKSSLASLMASLLLTLTVAGGLYFFYEMSKWLMADALFAKALYNIEQSDYEQAQKIISLNPYRSEYYLLAAGKALNESFNKQDKQEILLSEFDFWAGKAIFYKPFSSMILKEVANLYKNLAVSEGSLSVLEKIYKKMIFASPQDPVPYFELGRLYFIRAQSAGGEGEEVKEYQQQSYKTAEKYISQSIVLKNDFAPAIYDLSLIKKDRGNNEEAIALMEKIISLNSATPNVVYDLLNLYIQEEKFDKALTLIMQVIKQFPSDANLHWYLAVIYEKQGQVDKVKEELKAALKINPSFKEAALKLEQLDNSSKEE